MHGSSSRAPPRSWRWRPGWCGGPAGHAAGRHAQFPAASGAGHRLHLGRFLRAPAVEDPPLAATLRQLFARLDRNHQILAGEEALAAVVAGAVHRHAIGFRARPPRRDHRAVAVVRAIIEARHCERIGLLDLASATGISRFHRIRLFREATGFTPWQATARAGAGVILVLHDLSESARIADAALLLKKGAIVAAGAADEVLTPDALGETFGLAIHRGMAPDGAPVLTATARAHSPAGGQAQL